MRRATAWAWVGLAAAWVACVGLVARAQPANPVYVDDSASAGEAFVRVRDHVASGNLAQAVTVLQRLLEDDGDRVIASADDPDLFVSVRARVHERLLSEPALLERYRAAEGPIAERLLAEGDAAAVERDRLLTPAGFDSAVRLAREDVMDARFERARQRLEQLEEHPDRTGARAAGAAEVLARVAAYLDREPVWARVEAWTARARGAPEAWPPAARRRAVSPLDPAEPTDLGTILARPLFTAAFRPDVRPAEPPVSLRQGGVRASELPPFGRELRFLPVVDGDALFVTDGRTVRAFDRFTLAPRWVYAPYGVGDAGAEDEEERLVRRIGRSAFEDLVAPSADALTLVAATGASDAGEAEEPDVLHALDPATGALLWSRAVSELDPALAQAQVRGPVLLSEGHAVFAARKFLPDRRLLTLYLAAVDVETGALAWRRLVGSAGSLPFYPPARVADGGLQIHGLVLRSDRLGVLGAYETGTGRARWVRRMTPEPFDTGEATWPWEMNVPVEHGGGVVLLSPDRKEVLRLDVETGRVMGRAALAGEPLYLLRAGDRLVVVENTRVGLLPEGDLNGADVQYSRVVGPPGIRGRVVVSGASLLVPTVGGLLVVDIADIAGVARSIPLEEPGNVLALPSQLVVADDARVHSYLLWDVAERLLAERMGASGSDPGPAVTFAELAYRAGRPDRLLEAVNAALAAIEADPFGEASQRQRARLFGAIAAMLEAPGTPGPGTPPELPPGLRPPLVERLGRLVATPAERVAYLMAAARLAESEGAVARAIESYQRILAEDVADGGGAGRAAPVAASEIRRLVRAHGRGVYAVFEEESRRAVEALPAPASAEAMEELARRYPAASGSGRLWLRAAQAHRGAGRAPASERALEAALDAAAELPPEDPAVLGRLAGELVGSLRARGRLDGAGEVLRALTDRFEGLMLETEGAAPVRADAALAGIEAALAAQRHWPRIGPVRDEGHQALPGWSLMAPSVHDPEPRSRGYVMLQNDARVALWSVPAGSAGGSPLAIAWSREVRGEPTELLRADTDGAYLAVSTGAGGVLVRASADPAGAWESRPFPAYFAAEGEPAGGVRTGGVPRIRTPQDVDRPVTDLLVATDARTCAIVERTGRAVALDSSTGGLLWAAQTRVARVYDAALRGGVLLIAGDREERGAGGGMLGLVPTIVTMDARTGRVLQSLEPGAGQVHWVRAAAEPGGVRLVAGLERGLLSADARTGRVHWTSIDDRVARALDAWLVGGAIYLLDRERNLLRLEPANGTTPPQALDARERLDVSSPIEVSVLGADGAGERVAFASTRGVVIFGPGGELLGADGLGSFAGLLTARPADGGLVTLDTNPTAPRADGEPVYVLSVLAGTDARVVATRGLALGAAPRRLALMDGRVAVTAGHTTVLYDAPAP